MHCTLKAACHTPTCAVSYLHSLHRSSESPHHVTHHRIFIRVFRQVGFSDQPFVLGVCRLQLIQDLISLLSLCLSHGDKTLRFIIQLMTSSSLVLESAVAGGQPNLLCHQSSGHLWPSPQFLSNSRAAPVPSLRSRQVAEYSHQTHRWETATPIHRPAKTSPALACISAPAALGGVGDQ